MVFYWKLYNHSLKLLPHLSLLIACVDGLKAVVDDCVEFAVVRIVVGGSVLEFEDVVVVVNDSEVPVKIHA